MASPDTTTIRVPTETRDRLNELARRRRESAGEIVTRLVRTADEEEGLAEAAAAFQGVAANPRTLAAYRTESAEIEAGFDASAPKW
jgi:predicted DNA-binding protein